MKSQGYGMNERPPVRELVPFGVQHALLVVPGASRALARVGRVGVRPGGDHRAGGLRVVRGRHIHHRPDTRHRQSGRQAAHRHGVQHRVRVPRPCSLPPGGLCGLRGRVPGGQRHLRRGVLHVLRQAESGGAQLRVRRRGDQCWAPRFWGWRWGTAPAARAAPISATRRTSCLPASPCSRSWRSTCSAGASCTGRRRSSGWRWASRWPPRWAASTAPWSRPRGSRFPSRCTGG